MQILEKGGPLPLLQQVDEVRKADEKRTDLKSKGVPSDDIDLPSSL